MAINRCTCYHLGYPPKSCVESARIMCYYRDETPGQARSDGENKKNPE
ncbi:MAG: hypothetical protein IKZ02_06260 [Alphaproteobacteria bacterium]|nr:hypothetical protein [Alphaproteobacteria bacterium]